MTRSVLPAAVLVATLVAMGAAQAPTAPASGPWWAYSAVTPPPPGSTPRDCASNPMACVTPPSAEQTADERVNLPGSSRSFTRREISDWFGPADWYPEAHPTMPAIVARGDRARGIRACALCHHPLGYGRPENAPLAGLPEAYFIQTLHDFREGRRASADPRKLNAREMIGIAHALTEDEIRASATYYGALRWVARERVIEAERVPAFEIRGGMYLATGESHTVPLGRRIVEMPERADDAENLRDPRMTWIVYAPPGSIAAGQTLAQTCVACHGPDLRGVGDVPGIAGRPASYLVRQLYDVQRGARQSPVMAPIVAAFTDDDFIALGAYLASLD